MGFSEQDIDRMFAINHQKPELRGTTEMFHSLARNVLAIPDRGDSLIGCQKTDAIRKLWEAKNDAVSAMAFMNDDVGHDKEPDDPGPEGDS